MTLMPANRIITSLLALSACCIGSVRAIAQSTENTLVLPPVIYLTDGMESRIYYDNVVHYPDEFQIVVECGVGVIGEDYWSFTPGLEDEGLYPFKMQLLDAEDALVEEAETILTVIPAEGSADPLRIMIIGDSLTRPGTYQQRLASQLVAAGINYTTLGTVSTNSFDYEGYGGNTYQRYLEGPYYFRSPFVYANTGFDPERYFSENTGGITPTLYVIFLGINDTFSVSRGSDASQETRLNEVMVRAATFIEGMRAAAPGSDVAILLTPAGSSEQASFDAAYGEGVYTPEQWQGMRQKLVTRYIETFGFREDEGIYLIPASVGLDRLSDYPSTDPIHPATSGYRKIGDILFAWVNYYIREDTYPHWALERLDRDSILLDQGNLADNPDGDPYVNRVEYIFEMNPNSWSESPLVLSQDGLQFSHRAGAAVTLQVSDDLSAWQNWEGLRNINIDNGMAKTQIPFNDLKPESPTARFWRLAY